MQAESVLLEPWYEFRLELPAEQVGRAMSDLQRMNGETAPPEPGRRRDGGADRRGAGRSHAGLCSGGGGLYPGTGTTFVPAGGYRPAPVRRR